jgi:outer membrane protein OmpA-like peptidoglycan-associated protein
MEDCLITCISADGKELYLTRTDNIDSDIYVSYYRNGRWTEIRALKSPVNSSYYESHASISADGQTLYFTSNRKGGFGAQDIYRVERVEQGEWQMAENLGGTINTAYNEESPFITEDGQRLYFSSQGHQTMGGYDVFYCTLQPDGSWSYPVNLGYPLNSGDDEVFYVPVDNGKSGMMASARSDESPGIYKVRYLSEEEIAERSVATATVATETVSKIPATETSADRNLITVKNIMFDYNSYNLNNQGLAEAEKIFRIMRDFPDITLEVTGHADSKGSEEYNRELSGKRAGSVTAYLRNKGIASSRLIARGEGESAGIAINENPDGSDNPEGRKLNRHARIRFLNFENMNITVEEINVPEHLRPLTDLVYTVLLAERDVRDNTSPLEIRQMKIQEIEAGPKYLYLAGTYSQKSEAVGFLNHVVDEGYPDARILEKRELDKRIRTLTAGEPVSKEAKRYTIQVMALKNARDASWFSNLPGVRRIDGADGLHRYIVGEFISVQEALQKLPSVKALGYKDAFIMNIKNYK